MSPSSDLMFKFTQSDSGLLLETISEAGPEVRLTLGVGSRVLDLNNAELPKLGFVEAPTKLMHKLPSTSTQTTKYQ